MCSYPTHLYFAKPLTTPWVGQSMATIHRMAHPLRTIASGTLLLFHSETVTSTSRSNLSLHICQIYLVSTPHTDLFHGYHILPKYLLLCCLLQYTIWWRCEWFVQPLRPSFFRTPHQLQSCWLGHAWMLVLHISAGVGSVPIITNFLPFCAITHTILGGTYKSEWSAAFYSL